MHDCASRHEGEPVHYCLTCLRTMPQQWYSYAKMTERRAGRMWNNLKAGTKTIICWSARTKVRRWLSTCGCTCVSASVAALQREWGKLWWAHMAKEPLCDWEMGPAETAHSKQTKTTITPLQLPPDPLQRCTWECTDTQLGTPAATRQTRRSCGGWWEGHWSVSTLCVR